MAEGRVVRDGEGVVYEGEIPWSFKAGSLDGTARFDFMVGEIPPRSGPPLHVHATQDDTFYILEGVLTFQVGDQVVELGAGDFVTVPPGIPHTFDNLSDGVVRAVNVMTPGGLDAMFADLARASVSSTAPEDLARLAATHGIRAVGPPLREALGE